MKLTLLVLLSVFGCALIGAENDFKTDFGEKFDTALKEYHANMYQVFLDSFAEYYGVLMKTLNQTPKEKEMFELRLETIKTVKERLGDSVTAEKIKMVRNFMRTLLWESLLYLRTLENRQSNEIPMIRAALGDSVVKKTRDTTQFVEAVYNKWKELYATIPEEQFAKYAEYRNINAKIEQLKAISDESTLDIERLNSSIIEVMRDLTNFFGYTEYKPLVD